jgi:uncharacterized sulfatase
MLQRFAIAVLLCWLECCGSILAGDRPPNVVLIIADDQAWTDYGFMGHEVIQTPNLDRLARQSALFTRGYVPTSLCRPSLATMITGLYPHQHGLVGNDPPKGTDRSLMLKHIAAAPALPRLLGERGYLSLQTGKWWEGSFKTGGFTHGMTHGDVARGGRHGDVGLKIGREGLAPIATFLDECGERPFFLWYAPMLPHTPHNPPERLLKKYAVEGRSVHVARYYAMCEWFDETCGQLLTMLDSRKLAENTLVVYVTDNGWIQNPSAATFAPNSKRSPYDGGIRTPIMLRWPGKIAPRKYDTLVSSIDLAPTIRAACGFAADDKLPGQNLLELLIDGQPLARETPYGEIFHHDVADLNNPAASLQFRWCIEGDWKLIVPHPGGAAELYNLANDQHEEKNLATDRTEVTQRLTKQLDAWWRPQ